MKNSLESGKIGVKRLVTFQLDTFYCRKLAIAVLFNISDSERSKEKI